MAKPLPSPPRSHIWSKKKTSTHPRALTFSKEAARDMREKVEKLLQGKEVIVKTFHSFGAELIRYHADRCKVPGDFKRFEAKSHIVIYIKSSYYI